MITHYLYFWPVLILPFVLVLLAVPRRALGLSAVAGAILFVAFALATGLAIEPRRRRPVLRLPERETVCLDAAAADPARVRHVLGLRAGCR